MAAAEPEPSAPEPESAPLDEMVAEAPVAQAAPTETEDSPEAETEDPTTESAEEAVETVAALPALPLSEIKPKMKVEGVVRRVDLGGAFIDIGTTVDGLLHISQISSEPVRNVNDHLQVGQTVTVWVRNVDVGRQRIDLTMIEMPGLMWNELHVGQIYTGTVVSLDDRAAFVDIGAEKPGRVYVSELSVNYVREPSEAVQIGQEVQAKVVKLDRRKRQIDLSIKAVEAPQMRAEQQQQQQEAEGDKVPTAMELALRRAMKSSDTEEFPALEAAIAAADSRQAGGKRRDKRGGGDEKRRKEQEEVLARTLKNQAPDRKPNSG
jgi:transcriptional accessory protein Tex/SPT6